MAEKITISIEAEVNDKGFVQITSVVPNMQFLSFDRVGKGSNGKTYKLVPYSKNGKTTLGIFDTESSPAKKEEF